MIEVGKTDAFERRYMQKFRDFAGQYGEFVHYERDRGARDIGLHLTRKVSGGKEKLTSALCWFQLKGIMTATLSAEEYEAAAEIKISLDVMHLKYWYLQPMPTYLVVYVESADKFLILNLQEYVAVRWGKDVMLLSQQQVSVAIPKTSEFDEGALQLILTKSSAEEWKKALDANEAEVKICVRDYEVIWHLGTAADRKVQHRVVFWDWQSKSRGQLFIGESPLNADDWKTLREHWQLSMKAEDVEPAYPYIELLLYEADWDDEDDDAHVPHFKLSNGEEVRGADAAGEYFEYKFGASLNALGKALFEHVAVLKNVGLIEITGQGEWVSVAPWHARSV